MEKILQQKLLKGIFLMALLFSASVSQAQLTLPTGTSYTQNFNALGNGLPTGWTVRTGAGTSALGTSVTSLSRNAWATTAGAFNDFASANGGSLSNSQQSSSTDRALGIRQTGSFGDPGAAFVLQLANTTGKTAFNLSFKHQLIDSQSRSTIWTVQYSTAAAGNVWTNVGATFTDPGSFGSTARTYNFSAGLDNKSTTVYIRIVALTGSSGSGSRDSYAIDDFVLSWTNAATTPTISTTQVALNSITSNSAISGGNVTATGGSTVTEKGIVYGTQTAPTLSTNVISAGSGTGVFTSQLIGLEINTRYYYRAFATNTTGTAYGTEYSFYTLANTPEALIVSNPTLNSLDVAINGTDGNPDTTKYAIKISGGTLGENQYVNALGQVTQTIVYQTATQWATTATVTGLDAATTYTFSVKAQNGATPAVDSNFGPDATGTTLTPTTPFLTLEEINLMYDTICINNTVVGFFKISGGNLLNHTIHIAPLNGFSYSLTEDSETYSSNLNIDNYNGENITVYVRFSPVAVQSYNGAILLTGSDVPTLEVNTSGTGIDTPGSATTNAVSTITAVSATLNGFATAGGCTPITDYGVEYSTTNNFTAGTGIQLSSADFTVLPNIAVTVSSLSPGTTYYFRAYVRDGSTVNEGIHYGNQLSFRTLGLTAPIATTATPVAQTEFTANWDAATGAEGYFLDVSENEIFGTETYATDIIISEYVEVKSNNKAIEIYNGTGQAVNLSAYSIKQQLNGSGSFGSNNTYVRQLPNVNLAHGDVFVVASDGASAISNVDLELNYTDENGGRVVHFTGNDPIGLYKNDVQIDLITGGTDVTLVRNANVNSPTTNYNSNQWTTYTLGTYNYIGSHTMDTNFIASFVNGYNSLDVNNVTAFNVTGLQPFTTYYYRVRAYSTNSASANSNVTRVNTKPGDVTWSIATGNQTATWEPATFPDNTPVVIDQTINVIIDAAYNTQSHGSFTAKNVTLKNGKTFTVATGTTLNVKGEIINNAPAVNFVVENNGALLQDSDIANTADITVIKNSNSLYRLDYTLWSAPVSGQTLGDFSPATTVGRFYEYGIHETTGAEQYNIVEPSTVFEAGKGYLIRMPNGNSDVTGYNRGEASYNYAGTFTGKPNNGTVTKTISVEANRYTAVGNPYPSPISVVDFFLENQDVIDANSGIYFWRKRNNADASSYATLTLAAYTANAGFGQNEAIGGGAEQSVFFEGAESNWLIAPGQGFIVKAAQNPTGNAITFNNSMRRPTPGNDQAFFRTGASTRSRLWINLTDAQGSFSQTAVAYMPNATTGLDYGYDGAKFSDGGRVTLYTIAANTNLAVQARPAFATSDVVPVGYVATQSGQFSITVDHFDGLFMQGQDVYLKDNLLGTVSNLDVPYIFTSEAGTFNNRFEIVYTAEALNTDAPQFNANNVIVYKEGSSININAGNTIITAVSIYDINGRKLYTATADATSTSVNNLTVAQQVLIVEINTQKGKVSKRIVF